MANFSTRERLIASLLSKTPGLKQVIKKIYININAILYKKKYNYKILCKDIKSINKFISDNEYESFFGYYDKSPINKENKVILYLSNRTTHKLPSSKEALKIAFFDSKEHKITNIGETLSYTWQQGARCQWISDDKLIYNVFQDNQYKSIVYSIQKKGIDKVFNYPVQDSFNEEYFLSINYRRIMFLRPDYGYRNLSLPTEDEMRNLSEDGIWKVDYKSGKGSLIFSLQDIVNCDKKEIFDSCFHKVNHLMINKKGDGFIFIHRFYKGKRRFDRLMYSDFKILKVLVDDGMVSHCCWIDDQTIFGYFSFSSKAGYYYCNIQTREITPCSTMTNLNLGDGHPSCNEDWIVFDTYPDKSRMQKLLLYNRKTDQIIPLLELYQSTSYYGESRCDLHPRFSTDGNLIFFDSVYSGKRELCMIDITPLVK